MDGIAIYLCTAAANATADNDALRKYNTIINYNNESSFVMLFFLCGGEKTRCICLERFLFSVGMVRIIPFRDAWFN